ncbi:hypothetical protein Hamer_G011479 [Homarus americanus]|uniref:Uncharacterized protein n=1 Tax=Homarus americanus TaxID=6706 RepID=A0A8J5JMG8_HOMAM|nr:hypothetical protein Hamer_G011479 [Homarus americanus]
MHIGENLLRSNWSSSQLASKSLQFHCTMVAMIIGDLSSRDNPHVDPSGGPSPELTPGDGSPDGGSTDVTAVPGVQAASSNLGGVSSPEASERGSVGISEEGAS